MKRDGAVRSARPPAVAAAASVLLSFGAAFLYGLVAVSEAHTDPEADMPWFFERTVPVESGGRVFAGVVWDRHTTVTVHHGVYEQT